MMRGCPKLNTGLLTASLAVTAVLAWSAGSNNAANLIAAVVGARVLKLENALAVAAVFELIGSLALGSTIASTMSTGLVRVEGVPAQAVSAGVISVMLAAGVWILAASILRVPVSINETVLAGLIGLGLSLDSGRVQWPTIAFIYISRFLTIPLSGGIAYLLRKHLADRLGSRSGVKGSAYLTLFLTVALTASFTLTKILGTVASLLVAIALGAFTTSATRAWVKGRARNAYEEVSTYERGTAALLIMLMSLSHGASNAGVVAGPLLTALNPRGFGGGVVPVLLAFSGSLMSLGMLSWGRRVVGTLGEELTTLSYPTAFISYVAASTTVLTFAQLGSRRPPLWPSQGASWGSVSRRATAPSTRGR
ncbi:MAG: inorganic phosphate transporter [Zestosphaera sp.]